MEWFSLLKALDSVFWGYIGFVLIALLGIYLTVIKKFFQVRELLAIGKSFFSLIGSKSEKKGIHPLRAFFASTGGMIGVGNVVGIVTAIQIGGPGALFWVWVAGIAGSIIKYAEIYLGILFRVENRQGGYDGGPMYFLRLAFRNGFVPFFVALLLCVYGVEIYQFSVVTDSLAHNFGFSRFWVAFILLALVLYTGLGGVKRVGKIASFVLPFFLILYLFMGLYVLGSEIQLLPSLLKTVVYSAFTGHAAVGGFVGSSLILAIQHGLSRAAYSADIGIGYDSIIQSESSVTHPEKQARLAIFGVFVDNMICTLSILLVLVTGVWKAEGPIAGSELVQTALSCYFPGMHIFMPLFITILGFTTITAYFCVGLKCARFLYPKHGSKIYLLYGMVAFLLFAFVDQGKALLIMSLSGSMLLIINLSGIFLLKHHLKEPVLNTLELPKTNL